MNAPITARPDWRADGAASHVAALRRHVLDPMGTDIGILNCLYGIQLLFSEDMAVGLTRGLNDWIAREWLDREPRLRASIVVPVQNAQLAAEEIERCAADPRFVQVLLLASGETPLGRRHHWPIYAAAERHGLPLGIHAGSAYRHPVTPVGWPSYYTEDYVNQAQAFQTALTSLVCEGVFQKFPALRVVLLESGFTWLPAYLWRLTKFWRGLRMEVPWLTRSPSEIMRDAVRLTIQPIDAPPAPGELDRVFEQIGSDEMLLFSSDYPHWQFDGLAALPEGLAPDFLHKLCVENPRATYPRIREEALA